MHSLKFRSFLPGTDPLSRRATLAKSRRLTPLTMVGWSSFRSAFWALLTNASVALACHMPMAFIDPFSLQPVFVWPLFFLCL